MKKDIRNVIDNDIYLAENSVWVLPGQEKFQYSDGAASEKYLKGVFLSANDLGSNSYELENWIKDWPSEYHLSRKRAQLLRGFDFDKTKKVLEVGCGCGAITRFLGETFDDVVAIEGSMKRAELALLRTKGMDNVSIICAPFQKIKFKCRFDIIFCIGVFEYSGSFVNADDPYEAILQYFAQILGSNGILVLAIENQFGLKYFSSCKEDHTNIMFDGIEGYSISGKKIRTFGYDELKAYIKKYFSNIDFYFPYPDYKIPSCVLSEKFFIEAKLGELVGSFQAQDYYSGNKPLFDENLAYIELDKNNKLKYFSNSFLVVAGKQEINSIKPQSMGVLYSQHRSEAFQTVTRFIKHSDKSIWAHKLPVNKLKKNVSDWLIWHPTMCKWESGLSLQGLITQRVKEKKITLEELFAPCKYWVKKLNSLARNENNEMVIEGKHIDCIWKNCFVYDDDCVFIDQEWELYEKISLNIVIIRAIYYFLDDIYHMIDLQQTLKRSMTKSLIKIIAKSIDVELSENDFKAFIEFESKFQSIVCNKNLFRTKIFINLYLWNRSVLIFVLNIRDNLRKLKKVNALLGWHGRKRH